MDYDRSDSSGTDDDLPPSQPGRSARGGRIAGNGRALSGGGQYGRPPGPEPHLRKLEKDAYVSVLRAFTAQSEVITWRKEQLMVTLRQELRISDEQHLEFLAGIEPGGAPSQFRERHPLEEEHPGAMYMSNVDSAGTLNASRKKQKTTHVSQASLPPPAVKSTIPSPTPPMGPAKRAPPPSAAKSKKSKGVAAPVSASKPQLPGGSSSGINPWIGKRVKTRWPEDNTFYEAVITDYNPEKDLHALTYEMNTENETWEWVDLKELSSNDLQVVDGPPVPITRKGPPVVPTHPARGAAGRGTKKGNGRNVTPAAGRARPVNKGQGNTFDRSGPPRNWKGSTAENGVSLKGLKNIQLPSLDALVKQVEKIGEEDDLAKIESIKRAAKEHEEMLRKALAEVGESSDDGESDEENPPFSHAHSIDRERERRSRQDSRDQHGDDDEDDTAGDRGEGSDGEPLGGDGGVASDADDDHHDGDDG